MNEAERERLIWDGAVLVFLIYMFNRTNIEISSPNLQKYGIPILFIMTIIVIEIIYLRSNISMEFDK